MNQENIFLLVFIDNLYTQKGLGYHDILLSWQEDFKKIEVPVYVVNTNTTNANKIVKEIYKSKLEYISCLDYSIFVDFDAYKTKMIFGKKYQVIYPYMYIIYDKKVYKQYKRISSDSIKKLFLELMEIQRKRFIKNILKKH